MYDVLVNRLGGLSLPRKSVVRLTDRPDMTLDVYRGRKTTKQKQQQNTVERAKTTNLPLTLSIFACRKNIMLSHKNNVSIFDDTIISMACDFSNQEILSKMMLNAYSQVFITHSGFAVNN